VTSHAIDPERAATAAISGYAYQFDKTILEILRGGDADRITVEGVEDIDLQAAGEAVAIQCKYHEAGRFSLAGIRRPLMLMLDGVAAGRHWNYRLYAHFGEQKEPIPAKLNVAQLKEALTEQKRKPRHQEVRHYEKYHNADLEKFANSLTIEPGPSLQDQRAGVATALRDALSCSLDDVRDLHYADAFVIVMDLAMNKDASAREVTRASFVAELDKRTSIFTRWHREFLGRERYLKAVARRITSLRLTDSKLSRAVLLGPDELGSGTPAISGVDLVAQLARTGFGINKLRCSQPWTVVLDAEPDGVREIKAELVRRGIAINDGYEDLAFNPELFNRPPVLNTGKTGSRITRVSYDLRVLALNTFISHAAQLTPPHTLLAFREQPATFDFADATPRRLDVAGCDIEQIARLVGAFA